MIAVYEMALCNVCLDEENYHPPTYTASSSVSLLFSCPDATLLFCFSLTALFVLCLATAGTYTYIDSTVHTCSALNCTQTKEAATVTGEHSGVFTS